MMGGPEGGGDGEMRMDLREESMGREGGYEQGEGW